MKKIISIVMVYPARTSDPTDIVGIEGNLQTQHSWNIPY